MKTAISIPDDIFKVAEKLARRTKKSRSQLFSDAVREYVARHALDEITDAMNRVCAEVDPLPDKFTASASSRILKRAEWRYRKAIFGGLICQLPPDRDQDSEDP